MFYRLILSTQTRVNALQTFAVDPTHAAIGTIYLSHTIISTTWKLFHGIHFKYYWHIFLKHTAVLLL